MKIQHKQKKKKKDDRIRFTFWHIWNAEHKGTIVGLFWKAFGLSNFQTYLEHGSQ